MNTRVRLNTTFRALCAAFAVIGILAAAQPASGATLLVDASGQLIGATGVNVQGSLYDVIFTDESCATAYEGCNAISDLTFRTEADAVAASQALLDQVFLDGPSGLFDTVPGLTFGCGAATEYCYIFTPYSTNVYLRGARNSILIDGTGVSGHSGRTTGFSFYLADLDYLVLADWTVATSTVPEPASMLLLGTALLGAGVRRWRQKRG